LRLSATSQGHLVLGKETTKRLYETIPDDSKYWLEPGDLLVQRSNTLDLVGASAVFDGPPKTYVYPDLIMRLRFEDAGTTRWVWRYLNTAEAKRYVQQVAGGSAGSMPKITGEKLKALWLPLPPPHECERIADILDKADAIRRKRKEAIALTEDLLRSAFSEMFGDPVTNPRGLPVITLGSLSAEMRYGTSEKCTAEPLEGGLPVLRIPNIVDGNVHWTGLKFVRLNKDDVNRLMLSAGDLLFVRSNGNPEYIGRCAVFCDARAALFASYLIRVRLKDGVRPSYVQAALSMPSYRDVLARAARTTAGNYNISTEGLRALSVPIPDPNAQRAYENLTHAVRRLRTRLDLAANDTEILFNSLVHRAFCGELPTPSPTRGYQRGVFVAKDR
jgi:type I restriction enzyme S subunit